MKCQEQATFSSLSGGSREGTDKAILYNQQTYVCNIITPSRFKIYSQMLIVVSFRLY